MASGPTARIVPVEPIRYCDATLVTAEVVDGKLTWLVEVRVPKPSFDDRPILSNTRVRHRRRPIEALVGDLEKKTTRRKTEQSSVPVS